MQAYSATELKLRKIRNLEALPPLIGKNRKIVQKGTWSMRLATLISNFRLVTLTLSKNELNCLKRRKIPLPSPFFFGFFGGVKEEEEEVSFF